MSPSKPTIGVTVRMSPEMHAALLKLAEQDTRSLNAEILALIKEAIQAREAKH